METQYNTQSTFIPRESEIEEETPISSSCVNKKKTVISFGKKTVITIDKDFKENDTNIPSSDMNTIYEEEKSYFDYINNFQKNADKAESIIKSKADALIDNTIDKANVSYGVPTTCPASYNEQEFLSNLDKNENHDNSFEYKNGMQKPIKVYDIKEYLKNIYTFIYLNDLRCYDENLGYYRKLTKDDLGRMIYSILDKDIARQLSPCSDISAIHKGLCLDPKIFNPDFIDNQLFINCLNGVIYFKSEHGVINTAFTKHDTQYGFLNCINANYTYGTSIQNTQFALFLNSITNGDLQLQNLIREILGYILSNLNNAKKFFIFYGRSNSGKSVFLDLITNLVGEENVSNVEMESLSDPKYTAELNGKLLNVCSELPDRGIRDTGIIKALVSENDKVSARHLYNTPFSFYNKAKLIFATNNLPELKTTTCKDNSAFFNRIVLIPFLITIPDEKQDKYLLQKLLFEKDLIFSWAIGGLTNYINNGYQFSYSTKSQMHLDEYKKSGNKYISFITSKCAICQGKYVFKDELFIAYENFCLDNILDKPTNQDKQYLKRILLDSFNINYRKLHRDGTNKYGFDGIALVNCNL